MTLTLSVNNVAVKRSKRRKEGEELPAVSCFKDRGGLGFIVFSCELFPHVSKIQCEISYHRFLDNSNGWAIIDGYSLNNRPSSNGTWINGEKLQNDLVNIHHLRDQDRITFGNTEFPCIIFCDPGAEHEEEYPTLQYERSQDQE